MSIEDVTHAIAVCDACGENHHQCAEYRSVALSGALHSGWEEIDGEIDGELLCKKCAHIAKTTGWKGDTP